jgi:Protein of unknown function (DUF2505)
MFIATCLPDPAMPEHTLAAGLEGPRRRRSPSAGRPPAHQLAHEYRAQDEGAGTVRFTAKISYDASAEQVFAMLTDEAFQNRKLKATGALEYSCEVSTSGDTAVVTTRRTLPTDRVPEAFRALAGGQLNVVQVETWKAASSRGREGTVTLHVPGTPLRMTGNIRLTQGRDGGTEESVDGELKASVPLIGGRIERAVEPAVRAAVDVEQRIGREWLAGAHD